MAEKETDATAAAPSAPGAVIVPSGAPRQAEQRTVVLPGVKEPSPPQAAHHVDHQQAAKTESAAAVQPAPQPAIPQQPPQPAPPAIMLTPVVQDGDGLRWTAPEFIGHDKSSSWYFRIVLGAIVVAAIIFALTRDAISSSVIVVAALIFAVYGSRRPRALDYSVDQRGISIGGKHHAYEEFRSFAVMPEGPLSSIVFMPLRRFAPVTTIYFAAEGEESIVQRLLDILPFEEHKADLVDRFVRRVRF